jgi:glycosyltransferase involved in cell wall biosynthesis
VDREPPVTVIVPFYGDADASLQRLLASLAAQDYAGRYEVLIVDNHDKPRLTAGAVGGARLLHEPTTGSYAARNAALAVAAGDIVAFTDADCECSPGWLRHGVAALTGEGAADLVGGAVQWRPRVAGRPTLAERYDGFVHMQQAAYVGRMGFAATANCFVHRRVFAAVGHFEARLRSGGDREFGQRATSAGHVLRYAPHAVVWHDARGFSGLVRKARRLAGQEWMIARLAGGGLRRALGSDARLFRGRLRRLLSERDAHPARDRVLFVTLAVLLQGVRFAELLRLALFGGAPERR